MLFHQVLGLVGNHLVGRLLSLALRLYQLADRVNEMRFRCVLIVYLCLIYF